MNQAQIEAIIVRAPNATAAATEILALFQSSRSRSSRIKCITTGVVYDTSRKAAAAANISPATLSQHLNNPARYPQAGGFTFEKVS